MKISRQILLAAGILCLWIFKDIASAQILEMEEGICWYRQTTGGKCLMICEWRQDTSCPVEFFFYKGHAVVDKSFCQAHGTTFPTYCWNDPMLKAWICQDSNGDSQTMKDIVFQAGSCS